MQRLRLERVLESLAREPSGSLADRLCSAAAKMLDSRGVGIAMVTGDGHFQTVCALDLGLAGEELQLTLGEGPTYESYRQGQPVLINNLAQDTRWPILGRDADQAGIHAIFAFPLRSGAADFGALTLYRDKPGPLDGDQYGDALVFARVSLDLLMTAHDEQDSGDLINMYTADGFSPWEIHQATGIVSVQLGISLADAMAMLRGHAFSSGISISQIAGEVVAGRLQLASGS